jgi:hypothetical protein
VYGRRRRGALVGAVLAVLLAHAAFAAPRHLLTGKGGTLNEDRAYLSSVKWPPRGHAALVLGNGRPAATSCYSLPIAARRRTDVNAITTQRRTHE